MAPVLTVERERLVRWLRLLVDARAVTGEEQQLADELGEVLGADHDIVRVGDSLVVGDRRAPVRRAGPSTSCRPPTATTGSRC